MSDDIVVEIFDSRQVRGLERNRTMRDHSKHYLQDECKLEPDPNLFQCHG